MRILIADDEPLARNRLALLCARQQDLDVVAQAESGRAAIEAIRSLRPDVLLLDVELRDMTGFDVLQALECGEEPLTIMVTAHPEHAASAFDAEAIDYLTKPVDDRRFGAAIERARSRRAQLHAVRERQTLATEIRSTLATQPIQLVGERQRRMYFIDAETVDYVESEGNYVLIHVGEERYISRNSVKNLAVTLAPAGFVRIERSLLVNMRRVDYAERLGHGTFAFALRSGARLVSGPTYRKAVVAEIRHGQLSRLRESH